ncbi:MAG: 50S ribosomal protein L13 [candidate division WOR-3 bacterium]|nr:50S ribosomal protein L13 [candidate division WOR-3 bacterium]
MKTFSIKKENVIRDWWIIDAKDKILGRLASRIAIILRGKHKPEFTPHIDNGDFVIVINADKVRLTGKKVEQKLYRHHSGYLGGLKEIPLSKKMEKDPEGVIIHAVSGMLPKNKLGRKMIKKLKVYPGENYPHQAQKPKKLELGG